MKPISFILFGCPKYCSECGQELKKETFKGEFDKKTGKMKNKVIVLVCPNRNQHDYYRWTE